MFLLCVTGEDGSSTTTHVLDEMAGSGTVYALCGWKSRSMWKLGFREDTKVTCKACLEKVPRPAPKAAPAAAVEAPRAGAWSTRGLFVDVPEDRYNLLRTMIAPERAIAVIVPSKLSPEEKKKAVAELDSMVQALRSLD